MRVIGVVDLRGGCAVHARAGRRDGYELVSSVAHSPIEPGDAHALARAYVERLGVTDLYAADLDAIAARVADAPRDDSGTKRAPTADSLVQLAALGVPLWTDAGVSSEDRARQVLAAGATRVVVGLETLDSYEALAETCAAVGRSSVAFSLDLRDGEPVFATWAHSMPRGEPAYAVAERAVAAGAGAVIVLDLARIGTRSGLDFDLIRAVRERAQTITLVAGGGIRGMEDLARLARAGCDGALVGTALIDGGLGAAEVAEAACLLPVY